MNTLQIILILLSSAVLAVALFRVLRLPPLLAYFMVGLLLGPHTTDLLPDSDANRELAEFGVVFLMFSIGLEFSLPQITAMRRTVFGLGGLQVGITMLLVIAAAMVMGLDWRGAFVLAGALSMSSTAIVSKMLVEQVELNSRHGRLAIGVLLFQDLAVVPMLILIPTLGAPEGHLASSVLISMLNAGFLLAILLFFGKHLINPWFSLVAKQQSRELFVMNVLMITLMLSFATKMAGLSYALGAFIAGMLISETHYRYQVEADIAPFRDILLGLFFITIGMLLDIHALASNLGWVLVLLAVFITFKAFLITQLARLFRNETGVAIRTGLTLAQAGEFSFVLLAHGAESGLLAAQHLQIVLAASLLSMALAPFIIQRNSKLAKLMSRTYERKRERRISEVERLGETLNNHVIICGYGRSGQYLSRFLHQESIPFIALDIDPARVKEAASAGENVMYGDASRRILLNAAGVERAKALVISYADSRSAMKILHVMQESYPHVPVIVRTIDDSHMEKLLQGGATEVVPEVMEGSLMLASHALVMLGVPLSRVVKRIRQFREERYQLFRGFFHGLSDYDLDAEDEDQLRLHSVLLVPGAFAAGKRLLDVWPEHYGVKVKTVRRPNLKNLEPKPELVLAEGDVVVLQGILEHLAKAEQYLLTGK